MNTVTASWPTTPGAIRRQQWGDRLWVNALWFQTLWFICVLGREPLVPLGVAWMGLHWLLVSRRRGEWAAIAAVAALGMTLDATLSLAGVYLFPRETLVPLWLCVLWFGFAVALGRSLRFVGRHWALAGLCGAVAFPLNYWAGQKVGAVDYGLPLVLTAGVQALAWMIVLPVMARVASALWAGLNGKESES